MSIQKKAKRTFELRLAIAAKQEPRGYSRKAQSKASIKNGLGTPELEDVRSVYEDEQSKAGALSLYFRSVHRRYWWQQVEVSSVAVET